MVHITRVLEQHNNIKMLERSAVQSKC